MQGKEKVMKHNTYLSNEIDSAGYKAQYDEQILLKGGNNLCCYHRKQL